MFFTVLFITTVLATEPKNTKHKVRPPVEKRRVVQSQPTFTAPEGYTQEEWDRLTKLIDPCVVNNIRICERTR